MQKVYSRYSSSTCDVMKYCIVYLYQYCNGTIEQSIHYREFTLIIEELQKIHISNCRILLQYAILYCRSQHVKFRFTVAQCHTAYKNRTAHLRDSRLFVECKSENLGSSEQNLSVARPTFRTNEFLLYINILYVFIHILCLIIK